MGYIPSTQALADGAVTAAKIATGAVTAAKLSYTSVKGWEYLGNYSVTGGTGASIITGLTPANYRFFAVVFTCKNGSATTSIWLRVNDDATAANYTFLNIINTVNTEVADSKWRVGVVDTSADSQSGGIIYIQANGAGESNPVILNSNGKVGAGDDYYFINGRKLTGVDVTSIQWLTDGAPTADFAAEIYGIRL